MDGEDLGMRSERTTEVGVSCGGGGVEWKTMLFLLWLSIFPTRCHSALTLSSD